MFGTCFVVRLLCVFSFIFEFSNLFAEGKRSACCFTLMCLDLRVLCLFLTMSVNDLQSVVIAFPGQPQV